MLANGIKLGYKESSGTSYTNLEGLKEVPDIGNEKEKVENTALSDSNKKYEFGIGDYGDLVYTFRYENASTTSPYRVMRKAADDGKTLSFQETLPDGTTFTFDAMVSVKLGGGGVNGVVTFTVTMAVQSDVTVADPTVSE